MESYGAIKQVELRTAADARAQEVLDNSTVCNGKRNEVRTLWAENNIELPNNFFSALAGSIKIVGKSG